MKIRLSELRALIREEMGNALEEVGPNQMWDPEGPLPPALPRNSAEGPLRAKELFMWLKDLKDRGAPVVEFLKDLYNIAKRKWPAEEYGYWWREFFLERDRLNARGDIILDQLWTEFTRPGGDVAKFLKGFDPHGDVVKNHEEFIKWLRTGDKDKLPEWIPSLGAGPLDRGPTTRRRKERAW